MGDGVFCVLGAIVGAGFASGREIMQFFSSYGSFSWVLIPLAAGLMTFLLYRAAKGKEQTLRAGKIPFLRTLYILLYGAVAGGMTSAAGELTALTVTLSFARLAGSFGTLMLCAWISERNIRGMAFFGKLLAPGMIAAFFLLFPLQKEPLEAVTPSVPSLLLSMVYLAGYCGLNAFLAGGTIRKAGETMNEQKRKKLSLLSGIAFGLLLLLGNFALLPRAGKVQRAPLPMVLLLRDYGKFGYYLSAVILYLAVSTTLIAALQGMEFWMRGKRKAAWAALAAALSSLMGFQEIVGKMYPILGWACLIVLLLP